MYGKNKYGEIYYGRDPTQAGDQEEYYVDLKRYVPLFVWEKAEMDALYTAQGYECGLLRHHLADLIDQCFVRTATWGLVRWEEVFGITTNFFLTYEQRREVVLAKMRGQETTTLEVIRRTALAFTGVEAEVVEDYAHYFFYVKFVGAYGIPPNMQQLINAIEEIKPAHLGFSFLYRYVIWDELRPYVWNDLRVYTWDGLRVNRIDKFVRWQNLTNQSWNGMGTYGWHAVKEIEEAKT